MTNQLELALTDRHAGQAANLAAGRKPYRDDSERVETALQLLIASGAEFTADDVHRVIEFDQSGAKYDRNLVSSAIGHAAKNGDIVREDTRVSASRSRHASRNGVWRRAPRATPDTPSPRTGN
ncbi:hypothetical protein [Amycolatopsis sp. BJA-103]|uniref:hypothetical protein n=1 Tax=Amycolatopsis sp. BJA-103 TaxID=1911175 RepID=UPI000C7796AB|nr:hypothetical protein [Amycolatopsis sp. BJA-103]AUI56755.1 hypothetical protein BKN51_00040 [Amycolatopsis sp. BJA-103]AUI56817.1 hypothetical protein BKN51_00370 [Amycolatopsis sp. BJA-103]PNE13460.1 hypothetical protein B1H26_40240 [Amycolatopsis sp. BJA-103]